MSNGSTAAESRITPSSEATGQDQFLGQFIPLHYHYQMLLDQSRMNGFQQAIERAVAPGAKVVELGGGTGVMSFFAAKKASKVWCVERNPQLAGAARRFLEMNRASDRVEVVEADATEFVPPGEVDVVICEMLHSALLREKQIQIINAFKRNYKAKVSPKLPIFIPEATILGVQPVEQNFTFHGYAAPMPVFFEPHLKDTGTISLTDPMVYALFEYRNELKEQFSFQMSVKCAQGGTLNALRFVTKNVLSINVETNATIDWHNFYMIIPIEQPFSVATGDRISIAFAYRAGDSIEALAGSMKVTKES
jgi:protein arginine N-methyltransferase 1